MPNSPYFEVKSVFTEGMASPVDLQLKETEICMVSGPSGSGKSRFLKSLADLIYHKGEVLLDGQSMSAFPPNQWRAQVMYFSAESAWWKETAAEHFDSPPDRDSLLRLKLPPSLLNEPIDNLSSGERQRMSLLRGLQYQPKVLLLDEVTANLDDALKSEVEQFVQDYLNRHKAVAIWISHQANQIANLASCHLSFSSRSDETAS